MLDDVCAYMSVHERVSVWVCMCDCAGVRACTSVCVTHAMIQKLVQPQPCVTLSISNNNNSWRLNLIQKV